MDISVVIPNYNGEKLLKNNIPKVIEVLKSYTKGNVEIIVSDDASQDASLAVLHALVTNNKTPIPLVFLENTTGKNKGFSGNVDKAVSKAKGDIIILLNTDVVPHKDFLLPLLEHFSDAKIFAVGCLDESIENGKVVLRGRGKGTWQKGFLMHSAAAVDGGETTLWVSGGSGAFRKSLWDKWGGLQELYNPFYWEDIDLSYRAQKMGYTVIFEKKSVVRHEHETGSIKKNYTSFSVQKIAYRNQFFFTWLNATDKIILIKHILFLPYFLLKAIKNRDRAFLAGFLLALLSLPTVMRERRKIQKMVVCSDKEVIHL